MATIIKGENKIVLFDLLAADGSPLTLASLALLTVQILQNNIQLALYTYGIDHELEQGATTSQLKLEFRTTLSAKLVKGTVNAMITTSMVDPDFDIDQKQIDKSLIEIFTVE